MNKDHIAIQKKGLEEVSRLIDSITAIFSEGVPEPYWSIERLPASKDDIRLAIVFYACLMDDSPNAEEIGWILARVWHGLALFLDDFEEGSPPPVELRVPLDVRVVSGLGSMSEPEFVSKYSDRNDLWIDPLRAPSWLEDSQRGYKAALSSQDLRSESVVRFSGGEYSRADVDGLMQLASSASRSGSSGCAGALLAALGCGLLLQLG